MSVGAEASAADAGEEALLSALRTGDADAVAALVRRYQADIYRVAVHVLRQPADAEDVAQETFLRVYRGTAPFLGRSSVRAWLYRIAVNLAIDVLRRKRHEVGEPPEWAVDAAADDPLDAVVRREQAAMVRQAVDALPPYYRLPLILREWHGLTYEEIAAVLQIPVGTVRSRLHTGREDLCGRLRALMSPGGGPGDV